MHYIPVEQYEKLIRDFEKLRHNQGPGFFRRWIGRFLLFSGTWIVATTWSAATVLQATDDNLDPDDLSIFQKVFLASIIAYHKTFREEEEIPDKKLEELAAKLALLHTMKRMLGPDESSEEEGQLARVNPDIEFVKSIQTSNHKSGGWCKQMERYCGRIGRVVKEHPGIRVTVKFPDGQTLHYDPKAVSRP